MAGATPVSMSEYDECYYSAIAAVNGIPSATAVERTAVAGASTVAATRMWVALAVR